MLALNVLVLFCGFCGLSQAEVFTAMADMEALLFAEKQVTSVIDQYIDYEMKRLERLRDFAKEYQKRNADALNEGSTYVANPVNAYLLIKRLTSDWSYVEALMKNNLAEEFLTNITSQRENNVVKFPDQEDLNGAAIALMRLQDTYRLTTGDMADGRIQGVKRADELKAHDCFELGRVAYNQADYYHTLLWMTEAQYRMQHETPRTVEESDILEYLAFAMYQQGNVKRALQMTKRLVHMKPEHPRAAGNIKFYQEEMGKEGLKKGDEGNLPPVVNMRQGDSGVPERDMYEALCRGERMMSEKDVAKLHCYLKRDRPFLKLAPIKIEILHHKPMIVLIKNALSEYEISVIKQLATPRLQRATVHNKASGKLETASYRISKSAWLKGEEHPVVARINQRLDDASNLNMETAEDLQIANYGLGGHYDPHFDFARPDEKNAFKGLGTGNRIATFLFYMQAPDAGGATVFPELKIAIFPIQNDAVFWYNLLPNGDGDLRTRHAACPVLSGTKWVANKWIHERGQEHRRKCSLKETFAEDYVGQGNQLPEFVDRRRRAIV